MDIFGYIFYILLVFVIGELATYGLLTYLNEKYKLKIGHTVIGHISLLWPLFLLGTVIVGFLVLLMVPIMLLHMLIEKFKVKK